YKRVVVNVSCPQCRSSEEDSNHIFRLFPTTIEVWQNLNLSWIFNNTIQSIWEWLTWEFSMGRDISKRLQSYMAELDGLEERPLTLSVDRGQIQPERNKRGTIYFDASFDRRLSRSASALVVRVLMGEILASKAVMHSAISSPFVVEAHVDPDKSVIVALIRDLQSKNVHFQEIDFHFVHRSKNECAHILAHEALKRGQGKYFMGAVPDYVSRELEKRWTRHPG
ncbi:hypothetical protein Goshw_010478, partial [Gossypium schwendimanii]|nr:hypothetical protein [Gossypium schwendimanii]